MILDVAEVSLPVLERLRIRKQRIRHGRGGQRISIVTGIHGDELEGQYVCYLLQRRLQASIEQLDGTVDLYPGMNPLGIDSITRGIPSFDLDMNRVFPGNSEGSMVEHVASCIIADLLGSTACIDIHASNIFLTELPQVRINQLHRRELLPLARRLNLDLIWVHANATVLESTLAFSLNSRGTPTLVVEMGVGMRITKRYCHQLEHGILSLMAQLGMYHGPCGSTEHEALVVDRDEAVEFLNSPSAGIFIQKAAHGSSLREGELVGEIVDPLHGVVVERILAPCDGLLFTLREYPVVDEGSLMGRMIRQDYIDRRGRHAHRAD